ncbi:MAG TPA: S-formylglutathione hydrolase [Rhodanobacteraceae bacterium]|jgi:S-formylglutathione hydrolase|nr:S-formylglutathione hydrolase [Rhodanobacteraceae bacterium]
MAVETISEQRCFGGMQGFYKHESAETGGPMKFGVFRPPQAEKRKVPVLYYLAGLTCTEETFVIKAGAQRAAAELGIMIVTPDTSPRDTGIEGATGDWEFGEAAGFYLDATTPAFAKRFRMYSYVTKELPSVIGASFAFADMSRESIFGHSMGGHGALTIALKNPERYKSVSAFAPIVAPSEVPWGQKALPRYLGDDRKTWRSYDACALLEDGKRFPGTILVDQGYADKFLEVQLQHWRLDAACRKAGQPLTLRVHAGYDHSYYFIQTFVEDHLRHHAQALS